MSLQSMLRVANTFDLIVEESVQGIKRRKGPGFGSRGYYRKTPLRRRVRSAEFHWAVGHLAMLSSVYVSLCRHREITFVRGSKSPGRRLACAVGSVMNSKWRGVGGSVQARRRHGARGA
jgi:hypothetical protein